MYSNGTGRKMRGRSKAGACGAGAGTREVVWLQSWPEGLRIVVDTSGNLLNKASLLMRYILRT